jgi:TP901 family phage tail tape measure protein
MPSSTISIKVNGQWNGSALEHAVNDLTKLGAAAKSANNLYTSNAQRIAVQAASLDKSVSSAMANAATNMVKSGNEMKKLGQQAQELGRSLTTHLTVPILAVGTYAGAMAVQYDTAMANVRKVTDMTEAELEALGDAALELSQTQPVTAEQILNMEALGAQLGVADEALQAFSMTVNGLDIATNLNAEDAATQMAQFANITGMAKGSAEEAQRAYEGYGSTLVALGNNLATTESDISKMSLRLAAAGDIAGMSEAEILGMAGAMSSLGIRAEAGGSAMTTIMSKISKATASGGADLEAFAEVAGMSAEQFASAWEKDPMDALVALLDGIHNLDANGLQDMNVTLSELGINEIRQSEAMRRLANDTGVLKDAVNLATNAWDENNALTNEVEQRNQSMASRLQVLKNRVDAIAIEVGGPLVNGLIAVLEAADPLIQVVANMAQAFADADEGTQQMILTLVGIAAAAGPVTSAFGKVASGIGSLTSAFGHFKQDAAVYQDAMSTIDGSQIRVYKSADTLSSRMGVLSNKVVEAAGGADNYVKAWESAYKAQKTYNKAADELIAVDAKIQSSGATKALQRRKDVLTELTNESRREYSVAKSQLKAWQEQAKVSDKLSDGLEGLNDHSEQLVEVTKRSSQAFNQSNDVVKKTGSALSNLKSGLSVATSGFTSLLKSIGPMIGIDLAIAGVTAAVGFLVSEMQEAAQHESDLAAASRTFADMSAAAKEGAVSQAEGIKSIGESAEESLQALIDLNEKTQETLLDTETEAATLNSYVSTIEELGNKSNLTATEQEKLKTAVEGYNSITGESISVTDESNGTLSISTEELKENAKAWEENARAQALQEIAAEYIKANAQAELEYNKAVEARNENQSRLNELQDEYAGLQDKSSAHAQELLDEIDSLSRNTEGLNEAVETTKTTLDSTTESMEDITIAQAMLRDDVKATSEALSGFGDGFAESMSSAGVSLDELSVKLTDAGVSTQTLKELGSDNITQLATIFEGNVDQMVWAIQNYNNVPLIDKNGNVTLDDEQLIDAQGNLYTWNGSELVDQNGEAAVDDIDLVDAQGHVYTWNDSTLKPKNGSVTVADNGLSSALRNISYWKSTSSNIGNKSGTVTTYVNQVYSSTRGNASGGVVRKHADGFIANGPTFIGPNDVIGEAGAEAFTRVAGNDYIIPLTNRQYSQPFIDLLADGVANRMSRQQGGTYTSQVINNNYSLSIGGISQPVSSNAMEAIRMLFNEYRSTVRQGV